ncbi:MAG: hypothetical protein ACJ75H_18035 [Thermoanaerobaculia bacterium]
MEPDIADRLLGSTMADLDSHAEWERAQRFFYNALQAVISRLPVAAREQLAWRGPELPPVADLVAARVALWKSIEGDTMGYTPEGAAVRATLFAFSPPEKDGPFDAVAAFCTVFVEAGLPEDALVQAFHEQWPETYERRS